MNACTLTTQLPTQGCPHSGRVFPSQLTKIRRIPHRPAHPTIFHWASLSVNVDLTTKLTRNRITLHLIVHCFSVGSLSVILNPPRTHRLFPNHVHIFLLGSCCTLMVCPSLRLQNTILQFQNIQWGLGLVICVINADYPSQRASLLYANNTNCGLIILGMYLLMQTFICP